MRSKIQLDNIKKALFPGFLGVLLSDEDVEAFANKIQERADSIKYKWKVRIRLSEDIRPWTSIPRESVLPFSTLAEIQKSYANLMRRYPQIVEVELTESELEYDVYVIRKDGTCETIEPPE